MPLPRPRSGVPVEACSQRVSFGPWPLSPDGKRVHTSIFSTDPWGILAGRVRERCPKASRKEAGAFVHQAEENFRTAASASLIGAKPVLLYYSFLNLAKAYILTRGLHATLDRARHGISERLTPGGKEVVDGSVVASLTTPGNIQVFDEFHSAVTGNALAAAIQYPVTVLLGQVVTGHRLWSSAMARKERFVAVSSIDVLHDPVARAAWLALTFGTKDLANARLTPKQLLSKANFVPGWHRTKATDDHARIEQTTPLAYNQTPRDNLANLVEPLASQLWVTVTALPPYRRYYAYARAPNEPVLPPLLSMYAAMFYLGSVTRYRPHIFARTLDGAFGPLLQEFIATAPAQFLFQLASLFAEREIAQPAII